MAGEGGIRTHEGGGALGHMKEGGGHYGRRGGIRTHEGGGALGHMREGGH